VVGIAEELLFRRLLYGALAVYGDASAVWGSAAVFAAVHVPAYGLAAFPVDLAAGLVFGWQRWASGTWTSSAITHAAANVLQSAW
jgi:membrane protease YdiL (CAAX protease family)